ncbi:DUF1631 domain-containing protein [Marinobacter sp. HN1S83]|uniref:DUF1631 domain-containing protein n=1 Tax=Marinobacter sp. HN1S83 TaxID=3382301 RepID=UPI00387AE94B
MAQDSKVVSFSSRKPGGRFALPQALVRLRDASGHSLKSVLAGFFDRADDALFELADKAGSNQDQTAYFDAMRELRLRRKLMTVSILQHVSRAFNDIGKFNPDNAGGSLEDVDQDSLSLVDHSELEQRVAIENLVNKLRNRHAEAIRMLNARVGHLMPSVSLTNSQMPLSPEVICGGLGEACSDLDIDIRAKLVVLKLFDRLLADTLGELYQDANRTLIDEGVLPDMKRPPAGHRTGNRSPQTSDVSRSSGRADTGGAEEGATGGTGATAGQTGGTFSELSALLHQGRDDGGQTVAGGQGFLDTNHLMARLNAIQSLPGEWTQGRVVSLGEQLQPVLRADNGRSYVVGQVDSDVINLVSMLFDFILEDRQLHPAMKALIGRLQIPVLKVALSDKNFFNRGGHPVRKLLNELAMSAIGWTEKQGRQRDPLREKIESVVDRVLNEFTDNVDLFSELLTDFNHFMDLDRRRRDLVEQRLRDAEEGRAKQERAAESAHQLLAEVTAGRVLPEPVDNLLKEAWSKYLQWKVLREGEDSENWAAAAELTRKLVWSVDPQPVTDNTRTELLRAIPSIVDDLRHALQEISWDPFATDAAIRDLELAHVDVFQQLVTSRVSPSSEESPEEVTEVAAVEQTQPAEAESEVVERADIQLPEPAPAEILPDTENTDAQATSEPEIEQAWLDRADSLRVGSWIELAREGVKTRCKLAAFIKATGKYIFVNRSGAKVAEYHRESLAQAMACDEITMLDDGLIFDRALESIIDNLRSSRKD